MNSTKTGPLDRTAGVRPHRRRWLGLLLTLGLGMAGVGLADTAKGVEYLKEQKYQEAIDEFEASAEEGDLAAIVWLGYLLEKGLGVEQDLGRAAELYTFAAQKGDAEAQNRLGDLYYYGRGVKQSHTEALKWYRQAVAQNDATGQYNLGFMVRFGYGVPADPAAAVQWFRKAADQGLADAQNDLGQAYQTGEGVEKNLKQALAWFTRAAEQDFAVAQYNLGLMYQTGQGVERDDEVAMRWYAKAAEQGDPDAQYRMGQMYEVGASVKADQETALEWYLQAAEQGQADAQYALGLYFATSEEHQDLKLAAQWFRPAAESGHIEAQFELASMYELGLGVTASPSLAVKWYETAAKQGQADSQNNLGTMYLEGAGVMQSYAQALRWFQLAADQGHAHGLYNLAGLYERGQGVKKNLATALRYYQLSALQGYEEAQTAAERVQAALGTPPAPKPPAGGAGGNAVTPGGARPSGTLHVLAVGIRDFQDDSMNDLRYTEKDASALAKALSEQQGRVFSKVNVSLILGAQARRGAVLAAMNSIRSAARPGDTVVVYFSTHGQNTSSDYYLYMQDTQSDSLSTTALRGKDIVEFYRGTQANMLLMLDSCFSGALTASGKSGKVDSATTSLIEQLSRSNGIESAALFEKTVISSASGRQKAWECQKEEHGCFTAALLEGLRGKAVSSPSGITLVNLSAYLAERVPVMLRNDGHTAVQKPNIQGDIPTWVISRP